MSLIKSFSVGNGDMFYIKHGSDNFTIIDCCMNYDNKDAIIEEIKQQGKSKGIHRFISTHPDEDHIGGLHFLDNATNIVNFYCVQNNAKKEIETDSFKKYCSLRDDPQKAFYIYKGCSRRWMNEKSEERGSAGINILWPEKNNDNFKTALNNCNNNYCDYNNISPIISYGVGDIKIIWFGDLEHHFMESIENEITLPKAQIIFAPHHGRLSGAVPQKWLEQIDPEIIILGEAPSSELKYFSNYNTITQNSCGNIYLDTDGEIVDIYVSESDYKVNFLKNLYKNNQYGCNYIGTLQ